MKLHYNYKKRNSDYSDIISVTKDQKGWLFNNLMSIKPAARDIHSVIRKNKRFIIFNESYINIHRIRGIYVKEDTKNDLLTLSAMRLIIKNNKAEWVTEETSTIGREKDGTHVEYMCSKYICFLTHSVDVCGQALFVENGATKYINMFLGARQSVASYFGCDFIIDYKDTAYTIEDRLFTFSCAEDFSHMLDTLRSGKSIINYVSTYDRKKGPSGEAIDMPIPEQAKEQFKKVCDAEFINLLRNLKDNEFVDYVNLSHEKSFVAFQKMEVDETKDAKPLIAERGFFIQIDLAYDSFKKDFSKTKIRFPEYKRIVFPVVGGSQKKILRGIPVYRDAEIAETDFKYCFKKVDAWISYLNESMDEFFADEKCRTSRYFLTYLASKYKLDDEGFDTVYAMFLPKFVVDLYENPILEKLFNLKCDGIETFLLDLSENIPDCDDYEAMLQRRYFGTCDFAKQKLNEILGLPKGMFEAFLETDNINPKYMKMFFDVDDRSRQYFLDMNKQQAKEAVQLYDECLIAIGDLITLIQKLIRMYGVEKFAEYFRYLNKLSGADYIVFKSYIEKLDLIGEAAKDAKWKLTGKALRQADEAITPIYCVYKDKQEEALARKYKGFYKKWGKYEYSNNDFLITYPKGPTELVCEGMSLHHCAKQYVNEVGNGKTTILFVREKKKPDKPYYTLEIRDNKIRQCHGFDNCNVNRNSKLCAFLKNFCNKKGVEFNIGSEMLGV